MRHKILVVDDNYDSREEIYKRFAAACEDSRFGLADDFRLELIPARKYWLIDELLRRETFSAVILDVVLSNWKLREGDATPVTAEMILKKLNDDIPVALLSSQWLSEEVKRIVENWPTKNCRMFIHWDELSATSDFDRDNVQRLLYTLKSHIGNYRNLDYSLQIAQNEPINILHLSDLQFGGFERWRLNLDAGHCATTIRQRWPDGPHFVAVTGDIAENGLPAEYEAAQEWLTTLLRNFSWQLPSPRLLLVPGNHDVCVPLGAASILKVEKGKRPKKAGSRVVSFARDVDALSELDRFAFNPYLEFTSAITRNQMIPPEIAAVRQLEARHSFTWFEARFRHLGIAFFGTNTARPLVPGHFSKRYLSEVAVEGLLKEAQLLLKDQETPPLIVGLMHHSPLDGSGDRGVENPALFRRLENDLERFGLLLHGHWHERETKDHALVDAKRLVVNSAPSFTVAEQQRKPDTARGFSMIELSRASGGIVGCTTIPVEWSSNKLVIRPAEGRAYGTNEAGYFQPASS